MTGGGGRAVDQTEGNPVVVPLDDERSDVREAVGMSLGRAFHDEPNFTYMVPDPKRRRRALPWFFGSFVARLGLRLGSVDVARAGAGAAIWLRPGAAVGPVAAMRSGMLAMPFRLGWTGIRRSQHLAGAVDAERDRVMSGPHWYLMALGVDPYHQGSGLGRALLTHGLDRTDGTRLPCYLETFRSSTAGFYAGHGFDVVVERRVAASGPRFYAMVRPAKS